MDVAQLADHETFVLKVLGYGSWQIKYFFLVPAFLYVLCALTCGDIGTGYFSSFVCVCPPITLKCVDMFKGLLTNRSSVFLVCNAKACKEL